MTMRKFFLGLLMLAGLVVGVHNAHAVVIEGVTPSGEFRTVGVTDTGALSISGVVVISSTTQGVIITVHGEGSPPPGPTTPAGSISSVTISLSSGIATNQNSFPWITFPLISTGTFTGEVIIPAGPPTLVLPRDFDRRATFVRNFTDPFSSGGVIIYLGSSTVTAGNGLPLIGTEGYSPDTPTGFQGELWAASTATAKIRFIYHK